LISREQGVPLVQELTLDVCPGASTTIATSATTTNPKIAFDWRLYDDLKLRADWSTSFVGAAGR